jgi:predicted oxidoreductase
LHDFIEPQTLSYFYIMQLQNIHPKGPVLSKIITGVWRWQHLSTRETERLIKSSLAEGITSFDHADIYGDYSCEETFGKVLGSSPGLRDSLQLITKCGIKLVSDKRPHHTIKHYDTSKKHIVSSVENSLQKLATDHVDVLLIHRPDPLMNPSEVAEAFSSLRQQGKVLFFGVSNFTTAQFEMLQSYVPFPLVTNQIELSLFHHQPLVDGTVDTLLRHRTGIMAWSPLGGGKHFDEHTLAKMKALTDAYFCSPTQLMLAWLLKHPAQIFPIIGTTRPERIKECAESVKMDLERQHWFEMLKIVTGQNVA